MNAFSLLSSHWSGNKEVNDLQHTTLALTWSDGWLDRLNLINQLVMSSPSTYMFYPNRTFKSALTSYQPLSFRCQKAVAESQLRWKDRNLTSADDLKLATARKPTLSSSILVMYPCLNQGEWVYPFFIPNTSWTLWWVVEHRANE